MESPAAAARLARGQQAIASEPFTQSRSETLDIASFPGHGNEATLDYQKAHARAFMQARALVRYAAPVLHPPKITTCMGSGVNHNYSDLFLSGSVLMSGVVSLPCFSLNPPKLMIPNAKKMTPSHCFGLSGSRRIMCLLSFLQHAQKQRTFQEVHTVKMTTR